MNNYEKAKIIVDEYVSSYGYNTEMDRSEFINRVHEKYENISVNKGNLYPTDICYNLYNNSLKDFPGHNLCLLYNEKTNKFRLVGSDYKYTGPVFQYKGKTNEAVVGNWDNGVCTMITADNTELTEEIIAKRDDLCSGIKSELENIPVTVTFESNTVLVKFQDILICGTEVMEETYRIFHVSEDWKAKTSYLCEKADDGTWFYYLETIDECIGETKHLVIFEAAKNSPAKPARQQTSELRRTVPLKVFEKAYTAFMDQAERNAKSKLAQGSKVPYGFSERPFCDGAHFSYHFGQGTASATPYMNWWVVSIYYLPSSKSIVLGIETNRYPHIKEMKIKPLRNVPIGNKKENTAIFYMTQKDQINYSELYNKFIAVSEEVMRLGLK